jgi:UDP-N-acetylglucosamine:LPS N-acetylglucosamine transferase
MIKDSKVKESLAPMILDAINQPNILQNMQEKIKAFAITDADKVIAEQIIKNTL